jgi:hypothetical protein
MGKKFAIYILLWISLTFNLESNEMYSYFLVFYLFTNVTIYINILLILDKIGIFCKVWEERAKHSCISINNFLDGYKELSLCLCGHPLRKPYFHEK